MLWYTSSYTNSGRNFSLFLRFWRYRGNRTEGPSELSKYITNHKSSLLRYVGAVMVWKGTGQTYIFTDNMYWRYNEEKKMVESSGYPRISTSIWKNIPFPVDDAITWKKGKSFFFVEGKVFRYIYNKSIRYFEGKLRKKHFIVDCRGWLHFGHRSDLTSHIWINITRRFVKFRQTLGRIHVF